MRLRLRLLSAVFGFDEEATGYGSWEMNIAQGGLNVIMGNVIIQGSAGANHGIIGYDAAINALEDFYFVNNTVINQYSGNIKYFNTVPSSGINTYKIYNNIFASVTGASNTMFSGNTPTALDTSKNIIAGDYLTIGFSNPAVNDYTLTSAAISAIDQGTNAGNSNSGYSLTPVNMYKSFNTILLSRSIVGGLIDRGAFEYAGTSGIIENQGSENISFYPNPSCGTFFIRTAHSGSYKLVNTFGQIVKVISITNGGINLVDAYELPNGLYFLLKEGNNKIISNRITLQR